MFTGAQRPQLFFPPQSTAIEEPKSMRKLAELVQMGPSPIHSHRFRITGLAPKIRF